MNELPQGASVWLLVTVIDTDVWTSAEGSPMTTFETPCGETFCVFSEGLEIVPASPVRADQALNEGERAEFWAEFRLVLDEATSPWMHILDEDRDVIIDAFLSGMSRLRATPEPERAE